MFVLYFEMFRGHNNVIYGDTRNFLHKNGFTELFVMSLDFAEIKNIENMSVGMACRMH